MIAPPVWLKQPPSVLMPLHATTTDELIVVDESSTPTTS